MIWGLRFTSVIDYEADLYNSVQQREVIELMPMSACDWLPLKVVSV